MVVGCLHHWRWHRQIVFGLLLDLGNPYRYLEVRGRAQLEPDDDRSFAGKVGEKYGADLAAYDAPEDGRVVITIEPEKIHPVDMS